VPLPIAASWASADGFRRSLVFWLRQMGETG